MRSLLFVPGDSERKLAKAADSGADALILDLEDSVSQSRKVEARQIVASFLTKAQRGAGTPWLIVRINALDTGLSDDDLAAVVSASPDIILLPKAGSGAEIQDLSARIAVLEVEAGLEEGKILIHALMTETAGGMLSAGSFAAKSERLSALAWGAEDLAADIGASSNKDANGVYTDVFRMARSLTILAAAHSRVDAIDTVFTDFKDLEGLEAECRAAVRDGFNGKMAIHPDQVAVINKTFTPQAEDVERAVRILALFAAAGPDAGVLSLDGKMIDRPHLRQAQRIARRAGLEPKEMPKID
ncbi:CoA ester lyase [Hoeflea sp. AS60]|uniref:HpcH/HpaI aldolase/citrate lyase family protein n=1 Tax=Hoeflea sp. AS60 TaxID=3135780 RepID=UPI0031709E08